MYQPIRPTSQGLTRGLLLLVLGLVAVPASWLLMALLAHQTASVQAQDALRAERRAQQALVEARETESDSQPQRGGPAYGGDDMYRPVWETEYQEQEVHVPITEFDQETGKYVTRYVQRVIRRPVTSVRMMRSTVAQDPKTAQLATELREMDEDDEAREAKTKQLRERLEQEFEKMHQQQAEQIADTEKRLESLKKLHSQRDKHRDKIVQRRIDQLLGKADVLRWDPDPDMQHGPPALAFNNTGKGPPVELPGPPHLPMGVPGVLPNVTGPKPNQGIAQDTEVDELEHGPGVSPAFGPHFRFPGPQTTRIQRVETWRNDQPPTPLRIDVSTSIIGRLFQLARDSAEARAGRDTARAELERVKKLREKGVIAASELAKAHRATDELERKLDLNMMEFKALSETLQRDLELAESAVKTAQNKYEVLKALVDQGAESPTNLIESEYGLLKAEKALEDVKSNLKQLQWATRHAGLQDEEESVVHAEVDDETEGLTEDARVDQ